MRTSVSGFCLLSLVLVLDGCGGGAPGNGGVPGVPSNAMQQRSAAAQSASRVLAPSSGAVTITEFPVHPEQYYSPGAIAEGPDDAMWFVYYVDPDFGASYIDRIGPDGKITGFPYVGGPLTFAGPTGIAAGSDGNLWISDEGDNVIARMTTDGKIKTFHIPGINPGPTSIVSGPDGALWFTNADTGIGRVTTSGEFTIYKKGLSPEADFQDICVGPDGNLWFTEYAGNRIGRITTSGQITEFSTGLDPNSKPYAIASDGIKTLWFTQNTEVGRIDAATGKIVEYPLAVPYPDHPDGIASTPDGHMWYTEHGKAGAMIGSIAPNGTVTQYSSNIPVKSYPTAIASGPNGTLWFTQEADMVGKITP